MTLILGIETSCDETAASVVADGRLVRSNVISSQHDLHRRYQGVVPEIASRAHLERIIPVVQKALAEAGCSFQQISAVAVGNQPGLIGSLVVGVSVAKAMAWAADKPLIGVDHIQAHLYAAVLQEGTGQSDLQTPRCRSGDTGDFPTASTGTTANSLSMSRHDDEADASPVKPQACAVGFGYPAVGLVVSGGHTSLYNVDGPTRMRLLGRTIDDAVGEAFDKAAVILRLGYPGGPNIDRLAKQGDPTAFDLPRSLLGKGSLDFSFSGLKTALLYTVCGTPRRGAGRRAVFDRSAEELSDQQRADLAASFQAAAVDALMIKTGRALDQCAQAGRPVRCLVVGGGVSANSLLRQSIIELGCQREIEVCLPPLAYCLDNAAMIAGLAYHAWKDKRFDALTLEAVAAGLV